MELLRGFGFLPFGSSDVANHVHSLSDNITRASIALVGIKYIRHTKCDLSRRLSFVRLVCPKNLVLVRLENQNVIMIIVNLLNPPRVLELRSTRLCMNSKNAGPGTQSPVSLLKIVAKIRPFATSMTPGNCLLAYLALFVSPLAALAFQLCAVGGTVLKTGWV